MFVLLFILIVRVTRIVCDTRLLVTYSG